MRKILLIVSLLAIVASVWAVPATPEPIVRVLPDGSSDTVYLHGDEYHHFYTDLNGKVIEGSEYTDAALSEQTRHTMRAPQKQMLYSYVPSSGKVRVPVILVGFTDLDFTLENARAQFDDLFNGSGGSNPNATGSVHNYFIASSDSALSLEYEVFGPYTMPHEMAYYGQNKTSGSYTNHNVHARELVIDAVNAAELAGVDFSRYDANKDSYVDNVSIVVAGYNEAEGGAANTIWPHYSTVNSATQYSGKYVAGYLMISEYRGSGGRVQAGIGTYCHEFGHALGLPDLYDTEHGENYTVGTWDIMCSGSYNNNGSTPPTYTAFERFVLGWLVPEQITSSGLRVLEPIETSNQALMIAARTHNMNSMEPSPSEYFLLENRQKTGWDAGKEALVASGLLISHVTFSRNGWEYNTFNNKKPLGFDIVSAGADVAYFSSEADVFPGSTMRTSWTPLLNNGNTLDDYSLSQIRQREDLSVSMLVGGNAEEMLMFDTDKVTLETSYLYNPIHYDTTEVLLHIPAMQQEAIQMYLSDTHFRFCPNGDMQWYGYRDTAVVAVEKDSVYSIPVKAVYLPTRKSCNYEYAFLTAETSDGETGNQLTLAGRAPRPTYITTPVIDTVTNLTTSSFNILWEPQEDADWFYYMLYTIKDGESSQTERFESFSSIDSIRAHDWDANFVNQVSITSDSGMAVVFDRTGEYLVSPDYMYAPAAITIWLSNTYTPTTVDEEVGGVFQLSGTADGEHWENVERIHVRRTTRNVFRTVEMDTTHHWRQFRLSYTHTGGEGGAIIDTWTAHFNKDIQFIYRLKERETSGNGHEIFFSRLEPATTYYYAMQAYEEKGCEPHYSRLSEPYAVRTLGVNPNPRIIAVRTGKGQYTILLPEPSDGKYYLGIYSYTGEMITQIRPTYGAESVDLPTLPAGQLYMVKYYSGTMKRKDANTKILSY